MNLVSLPMRLGLAFVPACYCGVSQAVHSAKEAERRLGDRVLLASRQRFGMLFPFCQSSLVLAKDVYHTLLYRLFKNFGWCFWQWCYSWWCWLRWCCLWWCGLRWWCCFRWLVVWWTTAELAMQRLNGLDILHGDLFEPGCMKSHES